MFIYQVPPLVTVEIESTFASPTEIVEPKDGRVVIVDVLHTLYIGEYVPPEEDATTDTLILPLSVPLVRVERLRAFVPSDVATLFAYDEIVYVPGVVGAVQIIAAAVALVTEINADLTS
jgi:hypothetical protein